MYDSRLLPTIPPLTKRYLTSEEVADRLGRPLRTVQAWLADAWQTSLAFDVRKNAHGAYLVSADSVRALLAGELELEETP